MGKGMYDFSRQVNDGGRQRFFMKKPAVTKIVFFLFFAIALKSAIAQTVIAPESLAPGDPLLCWILSPDPLENASVVLAGFSGTILSRAGAFFMPSDEEGYLYGFLLPVPIKTAAVPATLRFTATFKNAGGEPGRLDLAREIGIEAKKFLSEDIALDKANTALRAKPDPAQTAQSAEFAKIFSSRDVTALFASGTMVKPLNVGWRETAGFGDERRYLYFGGGGDASVHGGVDLGAKEGTDVVACAAGRVAFAQLRILTGNTIVLEHLPGLFSIYMHLSSIKVREGDIVGSGDRIGLVGSTGLSTGPHLHWEVRIGEVSVNPYYWLTHPLLDKNDNSGKIKLPVEGR
jgi:murein DD-endopeptidase MepM/ murein hydrolase activator NlpD